MKRKTPPYSSLSSVITCLLSAGLWWSIPMLSASVNPSVKGSWPGYVTGMVADVAVAGQYAYVATESSGLRVLDLSDPTNPVRIGMYFDRTDSLRGARAIAVAGDYVYLAYSSGGFEVVDVSNPLDPRRAGTGVYTDNRHGWPSGLVVVPPYAFVALGGLGLAIMDVADPADPQLITTYTGNLLTHDVAVSGRYAYLAVGRDGLEVVDWSDPTNPQPVGHYPIHREFPWETDSVHAVAVNGSTAWIMTGAEGFEAIDVSDPTQPRRIGRHSAGGHAERIVVEGTRALVALGTRWRMYDLSDPTSPELIAQYETQRSITGAVLRGPLALLAFGVLQVLDISDPADAQLVGQYSEFVGARKIALAGEHAYLAGGRSLRVMDVSDASNPSVLGRAAVNSSAFDLAVSGNLAFVADQLGGLEIFDLSDPMDPRKVSQVPVTKWGESVAVSGDYVYLTESMVSPITPRGYRGELRVIDISDPADPREVGVHDLDGSAPSLVVRGSHVLVAVAWSEVVRIQDDPPVSRSMARGELQVMDVSDPANPRVVVIHPIDAWPVDLAVEENLLFLLTRWHPFQLEDRGRLQIIDISDLANPRELGAYESSGWPRTITTGGGYAFVGWSLRRAEGSLDIIDVADPAHPRRVGGSSAILNVSDLKLAGNHLFAAAAEEGLVVLELPPILRSMSNDGGHLHLAWEGFGPVRLEQATRLSDPEWQDLGVEQTRNEYTLPVSPDPRFFRLVRP